MDMQNACDTVYLYLHTHTHTLFEVRVSFRSYHENHDTPLKFWKPSFSGSMLNFRGVVVTIFQPEKNHHRFRDVSLEVRIS